MTRPKIVGPRDRMPVYIPSRSRFNTCLTLDMLGPEAVGGNARRFFLVVPPDQREQYLHMADTSRSKWGCRVPVLSPPGVKGIAATRKWIGQHAAQEGHESFLMLDDDLRFAVRANPKETRHDKRKLIIADTVECARMLAAAEKELTQYAHIGIRVRMAYHDKRLGYPSEQCVRALRALGYQTRLFNTCKHGRVAVMEDFDITLQLLARGWPNSVLTHWTQDQSQTQLPGGCSDYRTLSVHNANVYKMHKLWPAVTQLREKKNKTGGDFGKRMELTLQWKKCLNLYAREMELT
jgi:hypothetical protein